MTSATSETYTVEIIFHSAKNLLISDLNDLACDPYIHATLLVPSLKDRDKDNDEPLLTFRTPTVRRSRHAEWCPASDGAQHTNACATRAKSAGSPACLASGRWVVGGVPAEGFVLEMRVRDEDPGSRDDRLGRATAHFPDNASSYGRLKEGYEVKGERYKIRKSHANPRVSVFTYLARALPGQKVNTHGELCVSVRVLGRTEKSEGRVFTIGPSKWSQHFSPLIGSLAPARHANPSTSSKDQSSRPQDNAANAYDPSTPGSKLSSSVFVGNKLQLEGPVPAQLRHEFVGYRPFITWMFKKQGLGGMVLNHALKRQYRSIYSYDKNTRYGIVTADGKIAETADGKWKDNEHEFDPAGNGGAEEKKREKAGQSSTNAQPQHGDANHIELNGSAPHRSSNGGTEQKAESSESSSAAHARALALQFLRMTSFGTGGRLFTYVITLDGEWRWTETGEEFAVDLLSKHTMHADVARVIAWSGEFFVRRVVRKDGGGFESARKVEDGSIKAEVEKEKAREEKKKAEEQKGEGGEKDGAHEKSKKVQKEEKKWEKEEKRKEKEAEERRGEEEEQEAGEADDGADAADPDDESPVEDPTLYELVIDNDSGTYRPHKELLPILRDWLADEKRLGALGRVTCVDGFDPQLKTIKKERAAARKKGKGVSSPDKKQEKKHGHVGSKAEEVRQRAMEAVGKDESKAKGKGAEGRMAMARRGSSVSSIDGGVLGRRVSVSSEEVENVLRQKEEADREQEQQDEMNGDAQR